MFFLGEKMFKIMIFFILLLMPIFSKTIHFHEEKYYDALEKTFIQEGKITFAGEKIQIIYDDNTTLTYTGDFLYTEKKGKVKKVNLGKKPAIKIFFLLFEAIYFDKREILKKYFTSKKHNATVVLTAKENISRYISTVRYQKTKNSLDFLKIELTNKDWVRIEEYH